MQAMTAIRLAADNGGTFTDVVLETPARRFTTKVLTTPRAPELGVMQGIEVLLEEAKVAPGQVANFIHGTTLATNALIERKGAKTAFAPNERTINATESQVNARRGTKRTSAGHTM